MGGAVLSKSLIQFSVDGWSCVPSLLFDLRPSYSGGNEDNSDLLQKVPYTQSPQLCIRPPPTHTSARDSWTCMGKSGSVSCGVTAPFSSVLVHTRFCLCSPEPVSPALCKFWQLCGGLMVTSSKRAYAIPRSAAPRTYTGLRKQTPGGHKQKLVCTRTQEKGAVTPQETDPDLPVSVQESPVEAWVNSGLLQGWGH